VYSQLAQRPNTKIPLAGTPFGLNIYNLADPKPGSRYYNWLHKRPKRAERLIRIYSKNTVDATDSISAALNRWRQKSGNAPVIISDKKIEKSVQRLNRWYSSFGYFNNKVDYKIVPDEKKKKRAKIIYNVERHQPYFVGDTILEKIS